MLRLPFMMEFMRYQYPSIKKIMITSVTICVVRGIPTRTTIRTILYYYVRTYNYY